jgi:hypothetical protein
VTGEDESGQRAFGIGLFVVALSLRLAAAFTWAAEPVWDGHYYDFGARRIAAGFGYSDDLAIGGQAVWHPWCHYPVGYSGYLAAFYKLFGDSQPVAHVANGLAGALLAVVTWLLAREAFGAFAPAPPGRERAHALSARRAMLAGGLVAIHPGLVLYGALVMSEPLSGLLTIAAFWVALRVARSERGTKQPLLGAALGALVLGVGALVRPQALLCAPFLALAVRGTLAKRGAGAVLACALALVPVLPWTARNCRVMDGCALVSTNAGWNLAIGSFPRATGRFETLRSSDGCREVTGQVQQDRCWFAYGVTNIADEPWRWLSLVPAKLAYTFDHESFEVEYLHEARPELWPEAKRAFGRMVTSSAHRLLVCAAPFAFVAIVLRKRKERLAQTALFVGLVAFVAWSAFAGDTPLFWPIVVVTCLLPLVPIPGRPSVAPALWMAIGLLATTAIAHAVFFGEDRYHVAATPALCLLAAAALRTPTNTRGAKPARGGAPPEKQAQAEVGRF